MRLLLCGGGTAGHINPAVAVADIVKQKEEKCEILFVGTEEGMEKSLIPLNGYNIKFIKIHGFKRKISTHNFKVVMELMKAIEESKKIIKDFRPDVVLGTGGYVTGPVLFAASLLKIPCMVHESNAYPGVTVRLLSKRVDIVALAMREAEKFLKSPKRVEITGNPIRPSILNITKEEAREKLNLKDKKTVLIFGGSLGAQHFNDVVCDYISSEVKKDRINFIMASGKNNQYQRLIERFNSNGINPSDYENLRVSEYIFDIEYAMNGADMIIARSGSSVSEMLAAGKPAILIPSPNVAGNHQEHNARAVEKAGAAIVICEDSLDKNSLKAAAESILFDDANLKKMSAAAEKAAITDAAERLYALLNEIKK